MPKTGENIYKRKDGRWEARFISGRKSDGCAKYTSVYARTYAAAKAKLEERKRMVVSRPAGSCRLTVKELFVWYLSQAEIKPSTRARYVFLIEHHKKKRKKLFDALAAEEALAMSKALYEEGLSGMEAEYAQYAEAKAILDACGVSRQTLTEEKAEIYEQLAQINKQIRTERQKIKLCREIADSAAVMQRDVAAQEKSLHEKETEHSFTNRR